MARSPIASIKAATFNQGKFPTIAFVNLANAQLGVDLGKLVAALQKQMERDFVPIWGYPAKLYITDKPKDDEWQVVFLDDADAANALGYHDLTKNGQPISKVFVKTTIAAGQKVSVTASHELLEMMILAHRCGRRARTANSTPMKCVTPWKTRSMKSTTSR
jgi:hypothetical protein